MQVTLPQVQATLPEVQSPPIRAAATVVLLRDTPAGPQTFLVRRHGQSGFMAGATVFPGGKLDAADSLARTAGLSPAECAARLNLTDPDLAWRIHVAAIRELHEEAHVLLARTADGKLADGQTVALLDAELVNARQGHQLPADLWHQAAEKLQLTLALDLLSPFAHWLTPRAEPRRFDTWFFAAQQPDGQEAQLDLHEASDAFWRTPAEALLEHDTGGAILLPPPTLHTMLRMATLRTDALTLARELARTGVGACVEPHFAMETPEGPAILLPEDPEHPEHALWESSPEIVTKSRFLLKDGRFGLVRETGGAAPGVKAFV